MRILNHFLPYLIAFIFLSLFVTITFKYGLGATPDSIQYLIVANNILDGKGIVSNTNEVVNNWPPIYPMLLAFFSYVFNLNVNSIGLYLNAFLFLLLVLINYQIFKLLKTPPFLSNLLVIIILISPPLTFFLYYLSEGLFITLLCTGFLYFLKWIKKRKTIYLVIAGVLSGLLLMTRYAAIGFISGFIMYLILDSRSSLKNKIINLIYYCSPIFLALITWSLYTMINSANSINRGLKIHWISMKKIVYGIETIFHFLFYNKIIFIVFLLLSIISIFTINRKNLYKDYLIQYKSELLLIGLLISSYIGFLIFSISLLDAYTPLDGRILSPLYPLIIYLLVIAIINITALYNSRKIILGLIVFIMLLSTTIPSFKIYSKHYLEGSGFTSKSWRNSETLKYLQQASDNTKFYTNSTDVISFYTDIRSANLPIKFDPVNALPSSAYDNEMNKLKLEIRTKSSEIIFLDKVNWRNYYISRNELINEFKDYNIIYFSDGLLINGINF